MESDDLFFLGPMSPSRLEEFLSHQELHYAEALFKAGLFGSLEEALERSRTQMQSICSNTQEEQNFRQILRGLEELGVLWWAVRQPDSAVWIYDIEIHEKARRRGYARRALLELERVCAELGVPRIGLNVFAYNSGAEQLYRELGFQDTSKQMWKKLLK